MIREKFKSLHFCLIALSVALYLLSMFFTPFYVANLKSDIYSNSFYVVLIGWMAILGSGLIPTIIWLANPFYFISLFLMLNRVKIGIVPIILSIGLALYFTTLNDIMDGESGATTNITQLGAGFYLWLLSFIVLFFAAVFLLTSRKNKKVISEI